MAAVVGVAGKWVTASGLLRGGWREVAYFVGWVGMDGPRFLDHAARPLTPTITDWWRGGRAAALGATLIWGVVPHLRAVLPLAAGYVGGAGLVLLLHFGLFECLALSWRTAGVDAEPLMDRPCVAVSVRGFWSRWNKSFHRMAKVVIFRRAAVWVGVGPAMWLTFFASGLIHDVLISVPARGGYGLPTIYFLIQAAAVTVERRTCIASRLWTAAVVLLPAPLLFHEPFVAGVVLPLLDAMGSF